MGPCFNPLASIPGHMAIKITASAEDTQDHGRLPSRAILGFQQRLHPCSLVRCYRLSPALQPQAPYLQREHGHTIHARLRDGSGGLALRRHSVSMCSWPQNLSSFRGHTAVWISSRDEGSKNCISHALACGMPGEPESTVPCESHFCSPRLSTVSPSKLPPGHCV